MHTQDGGRVELRISVTTIAREALREVAGREGQTSSAFVKSCLMPFLRDEIRAIEARISTVKQPPKRCRNCGKAVSA